MLIVDSSVRPNNVFVKYFGQIFNQKFGRYGLVLAGREYREPGKGMQNIPKHDPGRARQKS